jgi:hypothetical protein
MEWLIPDFQLLLNMGMDGRPRDRAGKRLATGRAVPS